VWSFVVLFVTCVCVCGLFLSLSVFPFHSRAVHSFRTGTGSGETNSATGQVLDAPPSSRVHPITRTLSALLEYIFTLLCYYVFQDWDWFGRDEFSREWTSPRQWSCVALEGRAAIPRTPQKESSSPTSTSRKSGSPSTLTLTPLLLFFFSFSGLLQGSRFQQRMDKYSTRRQALGFTR